MTVRSPRLSRAQLAAHDGFWLLDQLVGRATVWRIFGAARRRLGVAMCERLAAAGPGRIDPVERRTDLDPDTFRRDYVAHARPVVMPGFARHWPAIGRWTPAFLGRYEDDSVRLMNAGPGDDPVSGATGGIIKLGEVLRSMREGGDTYARFHPLLHRYPELRADIDYAGLSRYFERLAARGAMQSFIGGKDTVTTLHVAAPQNLFVQIHGRKRWYLFSPKFNPVFDPPLTRTPYFFSAVDPESPDLERHPAFRFVDGWTVDLEPGDVLFIPSFTWHYVRNLGDTIGVAFRWVSPIASFRTSAIMSFLTVSASNPPLWKAMDNHDNFAEIFALRSALAERDRGPSALPS